MHTSTNSTYRNPIMTCFICNTKGHWMTDCPQALCKFCGQRGHTISKCQLRPSVALQTQEIYTSRTRRTNVSTKTFDTILYENQIVSQPYMRKEIDTYISSNFSHKGLVDGDAVASFLGSDSCVYNACDAGHLDVIGHIICKYCDVSNRDIRVILKSWSSAFSKKIDYFHTLNRYGISAVHKNNTVHFRKMTGYSV